MKTFCHDYFAPTLDLPSPKTRRWTVRSKQTVVHIVEQGYMNLPQAINFYRLSTDEFLDWLRLREPENSPATP
jgi:hypothetical protein